MVGSERLVIIVFGILTALVTVPSWSGRNRIDELERDIVEYLSPSPHGRVGTTLPYRLLAQSSRCHRPLMVGSERQSILVRILGSGRSPSPHGRVGTTFRFGSWAVGLASPSPHGRVGTKMVNEVLMMSVPVTVPSWSGRNCFSSS